MFNSPLPKRTVAPGPPLQRHPQNAAAHPAPNGAARGFPSAGFHYTPPIQGVFVPSKAFKKNENTGPGLKIIEGLLKESDPEFKWLMETPDVTVSFKLGDCANEEEAWGTTTFTSRGKPVGGMFFMAIDGGTDIRALDLGVEITIDNQAAQTSSLTTYIALAHEIGVHLKPRIALLRKASEGKATQEDMAQAYMDHASDAEHRAVYHPDFDTAPQNPTYMTLIGAFAMALKQQGDAESAKQLIEVYQEDVTRYQTVPQENDLMLMMAQHKLAQAKLAAIAQKAVKYALIVGVPIIVALLIYWMKG